MEQKNREDMAEERDQTEFNQQYDKHIIEQWTKNFKVEPLSKENWPECYPGEGNVIRDIHQKWAEEELLKVVVDKLDKEGFQDMITTNNTMYISRGADDIRRIVPYSEEWWKYKEQIDKLMEGEKQKHSNYMQTVEGSQWVTTLEQIAASLQGIKSRADSKQYDRGSVEGDGTTWIKVNSIQQDIDHLLVAVENAIERGYQMNIHGTEKGSI